MQVKGSPSGTSWYGVNSIQDSPGFIILPGLPRDYPRAKAPRGYKIPQEYLTRIKSDKMKAFCVLEGVGPSGAAYANLIKMADTLVLPSRPATETDFVALTRNQKLNMSGYGSLEVIGEGYAPYVLPVIRDRLDHHHEIPFWALPGQEGAGGGMPAPIRFPTQPRVEVPVPLLRSSARSACHSEKKISTFLKQYQ